ncbi:hypothetical protein B4N89_24245 [Embleya scabrispora]|uniref:Uncharacterized protein n=1 Tax=Embleya scabrispora TaxID=159449 RepID=A0A1T3P3G7_9ACTN|nr:hypothetical protein [Embleya scabrispora]OPC83636.1 hypothetical protein B4N89_24245 [Embleya scabrispora]
MSDQAAIPRLDLDGFPTGAGLLHLRSDLPEALDGTFSPWCDRHHDDLLKVPGFRRARRFVLCGAFTNGEAEVGPPAARYLTVYDLKHVGVLPAAGDDVHDAARTPLPPELIGAITSSRLDCREVRRWPNVSASRLFPAGDKVLHLTAHGSGTAMGRWLHEEAVAELLRSPGAVGLRWFDAGNGLHVLLCEVSGPMWPLPPHVPQDLGPAVWSGYRQVYLADAPA